MSLPRLRQVVVTILNALFFVVSAANAAAEIPLSTPRVGPSSTPAFRFGTAVASSGHGYLVAWEERSMEYYPPGAILVRAFDESGHALQSTATVAGYGLAPCVAWNGREYLVVMGERGSRFGSITPLPVAAMVRVSEDGTPIDRAQVVVANEKNSYTSVTSVAWNGSAYLVTWSGYTIGAALISPDLQIRLIDISIVGRPASVASDGAGFLVAGTLLTSLPGPPMLRLLPLSASGEAGIARDIGPAWTASLTAVDGSYELLWSSSAGLQAARVAAGLRPVTLATSPTSFERVAAANGAVVASWTEYSQSPASYATRVCTARLDLEARPVCSEENENRQHDPSIGVGSGTTLLAWSERTNDIDDIRIDVSPRYAMPHASGEGRIVSESAALQSAPAMERRADGGIVAVWIEADSDTGHREIRVGGADASGNVLPDRVVSPTGNDQYDPQISNGRGHSLITWNDVAVNATQRLGVVVDEASGSTSQPLTLEPGRHSVLAFDGAEWICAWVEQSHIRLLGIDLTGRITRTGSTEESRYVPMDLAVAGTGNGFLLAWSEVGSGLYRVVASRIVPSGLEGWQSSTPVLLDEASPVWRLGAPTVAVSGTRILVAWLALGDTIVANEVRQIVLDEKGAVASVATALTWPHYVYSLRSRPIPGGFAVLTQTALVLTSPAGRAIGVIDLSSSTTISDFLAAGAERFIIAYARPTTPDEKLGLSSRVFLRTVEQARLRSARMR